MLIEKLYKEKKISVRSYNICMKNDFYSIKNLKEYLFEYKTFINLSNCGRKSNEELIDLVIKYSDDDFKDKKDVVQVENPLKAIISNLSLAQIKDVNSFIDLNTSSLSARSNNAISHYLGANFKIKNFAEKILYLDYFDIKSLKNIGTKSVPEIAIYISIIKDYLIKISENEDKKDVFPIENPIKTIISNLSLVQREVINNFIQVNTNYLSVRSKNAISYYLDSNFKIKNFAEKILYLDYFDIKSLKNIGTKSVPEIAIYISIIKEYLIKVSKNDDKKYLLNLKNSFLIQRLFPDVHVSNEVLESESIFLITHFLLNKRAIFGNTLSIIIEKTIKIYNEQDELSLDEIAKVVNLSRERVRQLRKSSVEQLFDKLLFIKSFEEDLYQNYSIDTNTNQIEIDENTVNIINNTNKTDFSIEFITYLLYVYLNDKFMLVGNVEDVLQINYLDSRNRYNWQNFYLIKKEIEIEFDFTAFLNDISRRINQRINESYSFNFKSYLSRFLHNYKLDFLDDILPIAESVINKEFELYLELNDELIFKRNTYKTADEYVRDALRLLGKPSTIEEIHNKISEHHPNYIIGVSSVRASMSRINDIVIAGGKTSIYGLEEWKDKLRNFKGGTIRDIVEEYLNQFTKPKHISDISKYVLKYRPKSNQYSILQNIKLDESGRFVFFKKSFVGLSTKNYPDKYIDLSESKRSLIKSWNENFKDLLQFIDKEKRLPFSSGRSDSEKRLYLWFRRQKNKYRKNKLNSEKSELIKDIINNYSEVSSKLKMSNLNMYK